MLVSRKLLMKQSANNITYIGSVTKSVKNAGDWDTALDALDVLSIASPGDLAVIAFTFDTNEDSIWTWSGMPFTEIEHHGGGVAGTYVGYRFVDAADSNPYVTDVAGWDGLTVVCSVFRNVGAYAGGTTAAGGSGFPDPPLHTASAGDLWIATGHIDDDGVTDFSAPTNYTLAGSAAYSRATGSSTAIAYRIESLSSDDPSAFGGTGDDAWRAYTITFSG
jgi:hypothetical protein